MNTLKDLLNDLVTDSQDWKSWDGLSPKEHEAEKEVLVDDYLQRFKEENSKYFEWGAK